MTEDESPRLSVQIQLTRLSAKEQSAHRCGLWAYRHTIIWLGTDQRTDHDWHWCDDSLVDRDEVVKSIRPRCLADAAESVEWLPDLEGIPEGKRVPPTGGPSGGLDMVSADNVCVTWTGWCPIQGDGHVDGFRVNFRSRGTSWSFEVVNVWEYVECCYIWPDGGWIRDVEVAANINKAIGLFREWLKDNPTKPPTILTKP